MELVPPAQVIKDTSSCGLWWELAPGQMWINALKSFKGIKILMPERKYRRSEKIFLRLHRRPWWWKRRPS